MIISCPLVFALTLLLNSFVHSPTSALPASRVQDDATNHDGFISAMMDEDAVVPGRNDVSPRSFPLIEGRLADEDGTKRIFILSVSMAADGIAQYVRKNGFL